MERAFMLLLVGVIVVYCKPVEQLENIWKDQTFSDQILALTKQFELINDELHIKEDAKKTPAAEHEVKTKETRLLLEDQLEAAIAEDKKTEVKTETKKEADSVICAPLKKRKKDSKVDIVGLNVLDQEMTGNKDETKASKDAKDAKDMGVVMNGGDGNGCAGVNAGIDIGAGGIGITASGAGVGSSGAGVGSIRAGVSPSGVGVKAAGAGINGGGAGAGVFASVLGDAGDSPGAGKEHHVGDKFAKSYDETLNLMDEALNEVKETIRQMKHL